MTPLAVNSAPKARNNAAKTAVQIYAATNEGEYYVSPQGEGIFMVIYIPV